MTALSVSFKQIATRLREFRALAGPRTVAWGLVTIGSTLVVFVFDLAFAVWLQRFLASIELINAGSIAPFLGPVRSPAFEAGLLLLVGTLRIGATWLNGAATGICLVVFEAERRRDIACWALHSGRASLGEVTTLFNDVVIGSAAAVSSLFFVVSRGLLVFATLCALAVYSAEITLFLLGLLVLGIPVHRLIDKSLGRVSVRIQRSLADAVSRIVAGVRNAVFLQLHGLVGEEARWSSALIETYAKSSWDYYVLSSTRAAIPQFVGMIVVVGIAIGGSAVFGDDKGRIVAYLYLALRLFQGLSEMARVTSNIRVNRARLSVLYNWWRRSFAPVSKAIDRDLADKPQAPPFAAPVGWRLERVSFAWDPAAPLMRDLDLEIRPGSATVMVGPSGVGKTTLLLMLAGLALPTGGTIRLLAPDSEMPLSEGRARLLASTAYVGPDPFVVPGTIREQLAFGLARPASEAEIREALERAHCDFVDTLPRGLDHFVSEQGGGLSAGQKQRLALARALLRRPRVLLLDEATANLDAETERAVVATLSRLKGTVTIVAATHREALQTIADQVVVLGHNAASSPETAARQTADLLAR